MPRPDHLAEPLAHDPGLERTAVEQDRVGPRERQVGLAGRLALPGEELRHVPRHLRLGGEGEAPFARREAGRLPRPGFPTDRRKEAVEHDRLDLGAAERRGERTADDPRPAPGHRDADVGERGVGQQLLFGRPAAADERVEARRVERPAGTQTRLDRARERDVHVVAAEEQVLADGDTLEAQLATARPRRDQREVGRAAADVDHEDERMPRHSCSCATSQA